MLPPSNGAIPSLYLLVYSILGPVLGVVVIFISRLEITLLSYLTLIMTFLPYPNSSPATKLDKSAPSVSYLKFALFGAARSPLPSGKVIPFKIWLCPAIFLSLGSVFSAFFPTVSLPFVVSSLGVFSSSGLWVILTRLKLLFL